MKTHCYYIKQGFKITAWFCCSIYSKRKLTSVIGMTCGETVNMNSIIYNSLETPGLMLIALEMMMKLKLSLINIEIFKVENGSF